MCWQYRYERMRTFMFAFISSTYLYHTKTTKLKSVFLKLSFICEMALWQPWALFFVLFFFTPLRPTQFKAVCWEQRWALWEPQLHFTDTQACAFVPKPIKIVMPSCFLLRLHAGAGLEDWSDLWGIFSGKGQSNSSLCAWRQNCWAEVWDTKSWHVLVIMLGPI